MFFAKLFIRITIICFIHSKHGKVSKSASGMHEVVGQGIKNLGNMFFAKENMMKKLTSGKYLTPYRLDGVESGILRIRKGNLSKMDKYLEEILADYRLHRKCILSCSFISKSALQAEFNKIKKERSVPGNIIQLLWIISSFAHAAKDMNIIPIIYCQD